MSRAAPPAFRSVAHTTGSPLARASTAAMSSSSADSSLTTRCDNSTLPVVSMTTQWCARLPESIPAQTAVISHPHVAIPWVLFSSTGSHAGTSLPNDPFARVSMSGPATSRAAGGHSQ